MAPTEVRRKNMVPLAASMGMGGGVNSRPTTTRRTPPAAHLQIRFRYAPRRQISEIRRERFF